MKFEGPIPRTKFNQLWRTVKKRNFFPCSWWLLFQKQTFFNVGVLPHGKKLFPLTMQGEQAYAKFKAPIETNLQTIHGKYWNALWYGYKFPRVLFKEASYSSPCNLPPISLHVSISSRSHKCNPSISRPCKFILCPMKPRKLSSWAQEDEILTIWYRLRLRMLRSPKIYCIFSP